MNKNIVEVEKRINNLVRNFRVYIDYIEYPKNNPFGVGSPSEVLYDKIIERIITDSEYNKIFSEEFILLLYATLANWGMHRSGDKGPKMSDFKRFKESIMGNENTIKALRKYKINAIADDEGLKKEINNLYGSLGSIMESNSKLVGVSKTMHFLLPHLIPPMDRRYTMTFFNISSIPTIKSNEDTKAIKKEVEIFNSVFDKICEISKSKEVRFYDKFPSTIPKVIDNAIIGYVIKEGLLK